MRFRISFDIVSSARAILVVCFDTKICQHAKYNDALKF